MLTTVSPDAPASNWTETLPFDSTLASGPDSGADGDYGYPNAAFCAKYTVLVNDGSSGSSGGSGSVGTNLQAVDLAQDVRTALTFELAGHDAGQLDDVYARCAELALFPPSVANLVNLVDFGAPTDAGLLPLGLAGPAGPYWATKGGAGAADTLQYVVDFSTGAFTETNRSSSGVSIRCQSGDFDAVAVGSACDTRDATFPTCALIDADAGRPLTGLRFAPSRALRASDGGVDQAAALDYCNGLGESCGVFRLPSYKELVTLVNFDDDPLSTDGGVWDDGLAGTYWTSTIGPDGRPMAIDFRQPTRFTGPHSRGFGLDAGVPAGVLCVTGP